MLFFSVIIACLTLEQRVIQSLHRSASRDVMAHGRGLEMFFFGKTCDILH